MASIKQKIEKDLKQALLKRETLEVESLRMVKSSILNEEISKGKRDTGLSDEEMATCVLREVKKRKEAAEMYRKNGVEERAEKEEQELKIIQRYLPEEMPEDELARKVDEIILSNGGKVTPKNIGIIIQKVRSETGSSAQVANIARLVKQRMTN